MDSALQEFILAHENDDIQKMLLSVPKDGNGIDIKKAATIIEARKKAKDKIPSFYAEPDITYPGRISVEQCSSEATARYKRRFIPYRGCCVCDLTGGLGVDSYFLGMDAGKILYLERDKDTFEAAKHNFKALKADNIVVINADCESIG
ncbi:MAG: hypothetical protein LKK19_00340 [Bacteroidales bacterium]|jgi:hypothetical protein|nr:hypothetical protein [Bacteroidales bacterium]